MKSRKIYFSVLIFLVSALLVAVSILVVGKSSNKSELDYASADSFFEKMNCSDIKIFSGNPNYWDKAAGANCTFEDGSTVLIRIFSENSTEKILSDWTDVINEDNQIVYADSWFAVGTKDNLKSIFKGYKYTGPSSVLPSTSEMTEYESNLSICSSLTYDLIENSVIGNLSEQQVEEYAKYYPHVRKIIEMVSSNSENHQYNLNEDYQYSILEFSTKYDEQIKEGCRSQHSG